MRKKIKYILAIGTLTMGVSFIHTNTAKATMKNGNFFSRLFSSCMGRNLRRTQSEENMNNNIVKNLSYKSSLAPKITKLLDKNSTIGASASNFDKEGLGSIDNNKYYHQHYTGKRKITLSSTTKPQLEYVGGNGTVSTKYVDPVDGIKNLLTEGVPIWEKGEDINS